MILDIRFSVNNDLENEIMGVVGNYLEGCGTFFPTGMRDMQFDLPDEKAVELYQEVRSLAKKYTAARTLMEWEAVMYIREEVEDGDDTEELDG